MNANSVSTERLLLVPIDASLAEQEGNGPEALARELQCTLPADWEPIASKLAMMGVADQLRESLEKVGWWAWHAIRMEDRQWVGRIFVGRSAISAGVAHIGYEVNPAARCQGFATEAVVALRDWVFRDKDIAWLVVETDYDNPASRRVIEKSGFERANTDEDGCMRFRSPNPAFVPREDMEVEFPLVDLCPFTYTDSQLNRLFQSHYLRQNSMMLGMAGGSLLVSTAMRPDIAWLTGSGVGAAIALTASQSHWYAKRLIAEGDNAFAGRVRISAWSRGMSWMSDSYPNDLIRWSDVTRIDARDGSLFVRFKRGRPVMLTAQAFDRPGLQDRFLQVARDGGVSILGK